METLNDRLMEEWSAKRFVYTLGQALLGGEPTAETLAGADGELISEASEILGLANDCGVAAAVKRASEDLEHTAAQYVRLFIGPNELKAKPWESTYLTKSKTLFSRETLEVRNAYRAQGFLPAQYPRVADDHIALECGFMAQLCGRAIEALNAGGEAQYVDASRAAQAFLQEHLLRWVDDYAADLAAAAPDTLFACVANLVSEVAHR